MRGVRRACYTPLTDPDLTPPGNYMPPALPEHLKSYRYVGGVKAGFVLESEADALIRCSSQTRARVGARMSARGRCSASNWRRAAACPALPALLAQVLADRYLNSPHAPRV